MSTPTIPTAVKRWLKERLSQRQIGWIKRNCRRAVALPFRGNVSKLASIYGAGKIYYPKHYQRHFQHLRHRPLRILEIGIGGYDSPQCGGESLRMWRDFFPRSQIVGMDIFDKSLHDEHRIKTVKGSQVDQAFLEQAHADWGPFDIIIDDGSHQNAHVIRSFEILFPLMNMGGIYAVEDTQTALWPEFLESGAPSSIDFLRGLVDGLNFEEQPDNAYQPNYYDRHVTGLHFYHNLVFVEKGLNNEGSNILGSRFWPESKPQKAGTDQGGQAA